MSESTEDSQSKQCSQNGGTAVINHRAQCLSIPYALFLWKASAPLGEFSSAEMLHCPTSANTHCQPLLCFSFSLSRLHFLCFCHTQRLSMCVTYCTVLSHSLFSLAVSFLFSFILSIFPGVIWYGFLKPSKATNKKPCKNGPDLSYESRTDSLKLSLCPESNTWDR